MIKTILQILKSHKFPLHNEAAAQASIEEVFKQELPKHNIKYIRHQKLDEKNIPDFMIEGSIAIEIKIKGVARAIYRQLQRYAGFKEVEQIILVTAKPMGLPKEINGKSIYVFNINKAWL